MFKAKGYLFDFSLKKIIQKQVVTALIANYSSSNVVDLLMFFGRKMSQYYKSIISLLCIDG